MKILKHILLGNNGKPVPYLPTPNKKGLFQSNDLRYLVMHYTASASETSTVKWFTNKDAKVSAHLLIDRDGSVTQFAKLNEICWHAGESRWGNLVGMNQFSIGIEMVNAGRLLKTGSHYACAADNTIIPDNEIVFATHKMKKMIRPGKTLQIFKYRWQWRSVNYL